MKPNKRFIKGLKKGVFNLIATVLVIAGALGGPLGDEAKTFFEKYCELERKCDPAIADLYCDGAGIKNTRHYPNGTTRTMQLSGATYKQLIRLTMPLAQKRGDTNTYSEVTYTEEEGKVKITATRYSHLKNTPAHLR